MAAQTFNDKVTEVVSTVHAAVKARREYEKEHGAEAAAERFKWTWADREHRGQKIEALIDAEIEQAGAVPESKQLERLADALLNEELTDMTPYKLANTEYPIMNERTFEDHGARDTSAAAADADRERRLLGARRRRSDYENRWIDRRAKAKNAERRKRYTDFIEGRAPGLFTVNIATGEKITHE